jgi:PAS domain S-box-containing protein
MIYDLQLQTQYIAELGQLVADLRYHQLLIQNVNDAIIVLDTDLRIQSWNRAAEQIYGWAATETHGQSLTSIIPIIEYLEGSTPPNLPAALQRAAPWKGEVIQHHRDSHELFIEIATQPIRDIHGTLVGSISINRDITERKRAEAQIQQLFAAEQHARQVAAVLSDANLILSQTLDLSTMLALVLEQLAQLIPYTSASIMLRENDGHLHVGAQRGYDRWTAADQTHPSTIPIGTVPHLDAVIRTNESLLIPDTLHYPGWPVYAGTEHVRSWLGVPLRAGDRAIGLCSLDQTHPDCFTDAHRRVAETLGTQAAIAIQNRRLFTQVLAGRERLQALSQQLVAVQEAERRRIARELHDEIGQSLTGLKLVLEMISRLPVERMLDRLREAQVAVTDLMAYVRELSLDLRPAMLDDLGLLPALLWHFDRYMAQTNMRVVFKHTNIHSRFPAEVEIAAYRIVQEALTNVARHAGVDEVIVQIWADSALLSLQIVDHGRGCDPQTALSAHTSSGLSGMRERAILLGGQLTILSRPGAGTCLTTILPVQGRIERRAEERYQ